jgi:hypothetical protein
MIGGTDHKDAPRALEELGLPSRDRVRSRIWRRANSG